MIPENMYRFLLAVLIICQRFGESTAFDCGVMNCDWGREFCNTYQQRCEDCDGHRHSCFTHKMEPNCSAACLEYENKRQREKGCMHPPNIISGQYNETRSYYEYGSQVKVKCLSEHRLLGNPVITCGDYGQWTNPPICDTDTKSWSDGLVYGLIIALSFFLIAFLSLSIYIICLHAKKSRSQFPKAAPNHDGKYDTNTDPEELKEPLIEEKNAPIKIKVGSTVFESHASGEAEESNNLCAEPVNSRDTIETENESDNMSNCQDQVKVPFGDQLSSLVSDNSREQTEFSNNEDLNGCYMRSDGVHSMGDNSAGLPTRCQASQTSFRSKDSGFDSRATLSSAQIGLMNIAGQTVNCTIQYAGCNNDPRENHVELVDEGNVDPIQETEKSKEPDHSEAVEETSNGKPCLTVIG